MGGLFRINGDRLDGSAFTGDRWEDQSIQTPGGMGVLRHFDREMAYQTTPSPPMFGNAPIGGHPLDATLAPRTRTSATYTNPFTGESWRIRYNPGTGRWESPEGVPLAALAARR
jgi:hypothetical protein